MSIINEALRKAVRDKSQASASIEERDAVRRHIGLEFRKNPKPPLNWGPIFILLILVLITGPIVAPLFSSPFKNVGPKGSGGALNAPAEIRDLASASISDVKANQKAQFVVEEVPFVGGLNPPVNVTHGPEFNLTGIVYAPKNGYCILNGKIVKVGDTIEGAKLLAVLPDAVRLEIKGKETLLGLGND